MTFLVRHTEPAVDPDHQPHEWQLSEAGRRSARSLGHVLPTDAVLVASPEPKARQTLEPLGRVLDDQRFREVVRDEPLTATSEPGAWTTSPAPTTPPGNPESGWSRASTMRSGSDQQSRVAQ